MRCVLGILAENKLYAKEKKCWFGQLEIEYLGHFISQQGVVVGSSKIRAVMDWPSPCSLREVRGFLGLMGYYHQFVQNYEKLAWPLTKQLRKDNFYWDESLEQAF